MRSSRTLALSAAALVSALALSACGGKSTVFGGGSTVTQPVSTHSITQTTGTLPATTTTTAPSVSTATTGQATTSVPSRTITHTTTTGTPNTTITGTTSTSPPRATTTRPLAIRPVTATGDPCWTDDMKPTYLGSSRTAGISVARFSLTNTESATCHTGGWPKINFLSAGGGVLSEELRNTARDALGATPRTVVNLAPGEKVWFRIITGRTGSASACAKTSEIALTVPFDSLAQNIDIPGGLPVCAGASVSPVMPHYVWVAAG